MFGEHAVVYGRPAIAVPLHALQVNARLRSAPQGEPGRLWVEAPEVGFAGWVPLRPAGESEPAAAARHTAGVAETVTSAVDGLALAVRLGLDYFQAAPTQALHLEVRSEIPVAAGMGSSAALSVAILRAVAEVLDQPLSSEAASELAFQVDRHYHGTPSGIDNAVVAYGSPIYFELGSDPTPIEVPAPFTLMLADCGRPSATRQMVEGVRNRWEADRAAYEKHFDSIGRLVERARSALAAGQPDELGPLMDENQRLLERVGVSSPELEALILAARGAGARGAKLSGAGGGGLVLALVQAETTETVQQALQQAGAARTFVTGVGAGGR